MSHELRTPLNAIIGFSEIMQSAMFGPLGTDKYGEYCRDINQSGQYLLDVINDVLDMSKIEAGRIRPDLSEIRIGRLLNDAMRVVSARADDKRLTLTADIAHGIRVIADARLLKQIVLNLLSNAVKFTPEGGHIIVRARSSGAQARIVIMDSGIGIPKEALARLGARSSRSRATSPRLIRARGSALPLPSRSPSCMAARCASARRRAEARW